MKSIKAVIFDWAGTTIDYGCFAPIKGFIDGYKSIGVDITNEMARQPMGLLKIDHVRAIADMLSDSLSEEHILHVYRVFEETLFANIGRHCDIKDGVLETVAELRKHRIKIGSTTGYTAAMMERVIPATAMQGYSPDYSISSDQTVKGRPYPYMIWNNLMHFLLADPRETVKVGDTVADIMEGKNANCWTVGVVMGSSELGLSRKEVAIMDVVELARRKAAVRSTYKNAGVDFIIDDMPELLEIIESINMQIG